MGDIHGNHKAMLQCFERSKFNKKTDRLIQLGDVADGWPEVASCVDELLTCENLVPIKGNHDEWFRQWMERGSHPDAWLQGGEGTLREYCKRAAVPYTPSMGGFRTQLTTADIPSDHKDFFLERQLNYYLDGENNLFVHGGFNHHFLLTQQPANPMCFYWDRDLFNLAKNSDKVIERTTKAGNKPPHGLKFKEEFKNIFIGHTQTTYYGTDKPMNVGQGKIWNLDTGAGWSGKLTIMDVNTKEYWQSDNANSLHPGEKGRS